MEHHTASRSRRSLRLGAAAAAGLGLVVATPSAQTATPDLESELHHAVETQRAERRLPGLAALVYSSDGVLASASAGVRRVGAAPQLGTGDLLHIGSLTKALTAMLVATLVEEGRLSWNTRIEDVFPELVAVMSPAYREITLSDLLDHRAGIRQWTNGLFVPKSFPGDAAEQRLVATRSLLLRRPVLRPGRYRYSNAGYVIVAAMAERVTGSRWEDLLTRRVLAPLGLSAFFGWPLDAGRNQPSGHSNVRRRFRPTAPDAYRLPAFLAPAGDVPMTLEDYATFARQHLRAARGLSTGLLSADVIARLQPTGPTHHFGWQGSSYKGIELLGGEGSAGTFYALSIVVPKMDRGIVVIANAGGRAARRAVIAVALSVLGG